MKIISIGDIHEDFSNLIPLKNELENADLVIVTGDLTNFNGRKEAKKVIDEIMKYNKNVLAQLGNLDQPEVNDYLTEKGINLHRNGFIRDDIGIFGVGGSNPTPFNTPTEFSEDEIETFLLEGIGKVRNTKFKIMVPHMPPKDTKLDIISAGVHVGSQSVRNFILKHKPDIALSGHIHEARGSDTIENTLVFNAGMFREGGYVIITKQSESLSAELKVLT
ncbi:MAG: metallophosphoesterase [Candidatus Scalindua rubra]|uniref:Putative metallophosphoesterase n=1 Tax=Candidatus Scalindua brodae TaxID=237368 RepID=A0A0B0EEY5_9BACT|nr:MAG: putative metallophosphoesterase [Candidatus Scalindua brodae]MBZ0110595.1 metallophosphoesterase [Candidatus Scalindua rubra]TWU34611.1 Calcineurin-like phosphoesterase superfamily domain protein [Candidatus Brocadiaceae bacterium S225]